MKDSQRLRRLINDSAHFLSKHDSNSLDQLVQGGEALECRPIAKRAFVALLILENVQKDADDIAFLRGLYKPLDHECDVELFRSVYLLRHTGDQT